VANRLAKATSPYLLQHKGNPVHWWEWGDEAFAEARRLDVPVLLSVGYAACHWCHVMAHESFEDETTAHEMNTGFVNVKVDREERPDVDAVYMAATQALTGQGGWPMTVFLTPDGKPFYAGTYFPPTPVHGMPAFRQVLAAVREAWQQRREEVDGAAGRISAALGRRATPAGDGPPGEQRLAEAVRALAAEEDRTHGGFGGAPKFPPSMVCEFLLRHAATDAGTAGLARDLAGRTLSAMAHSGMYDQLAGGFARYAVDAGWVVPHFEKMLYDNALLARVYLHWWRLTGEPTGRRIAEETCDWMLAELGTSEGGLASSLNADTPVPGPDGTVRGVEGATYVWTPDELTTVLGPDDGVWAAELLGVTAAGTFEHGTSTLQLTRDVWADPASAERWRRLRSVLHQARAGRPQPTRDDKVVTAWNGLAVAALAETGALCDRPDLVAAAERCADLLLAVHLRHDGLRRVSRDGAVGEPAAVLEDHADMAEGLFALHAVTGDPAWVELASVLLDVVLADFTDGEGGFYDTAAHATDAPLAAVGRPQDPTDAATPSGWAAAAGALLTSSALTGASRHRVAAERALGVVDALAGKAPRFAGWGLAVAQAMLDGPREVAVVGPAGDDATTRLHRTALAGTAPGLVVSVGEPDDTGEDAAVPLLRHRSLVGGRPAAYVCRGFVCQAPVTEPAELAAAVAARLSALTADA
jgi:uncharacterized protein YyaL (SSP411 family)